MRPSPTSSTKQKFLNTVYEKFFQGFCVKVADTHGIVYTPPPIVRFLVASVEWQLKTHFGKSLASPDVHILDPFGGTGNFTVHTMQAISKTALAHKFAHELWTNEIMLLPYYVGYDNNKNRKHAEVDRWVADTYAADFKASNKNSLSDPYVNAIRWASNRIGEQGIVAFDTNNGFIDGIACYGLRKHLAQDFDKVYVFDLGANVRKNPKLSGTTQNVFGIQVGVSVNLFVRKPNLADTLTP
jgi:predicted helicase